jgi:hypothetical protein
MATVAPSLVWLGPQERATPVVAEHRVALFALAAVLALGCAVRFIALDVAPLHNNELNHYYVARALQSGGQPVLPSGEWYARGLEYSRIVAFALPRFQPAELAVRLPAAVFGSLCIVVFAFMAWRMARPYAALYATLLFAVFPPFVELSRFGRFYTLQMLFGLVAMFAGWQALRDVPDGEWSRRTLLSQWGWIGLAGAALGMAAHIQIVTLSVGLGLAAALAVRAGRDARSFGWHALRQSMAVQLLLLSLFVAAAVFALAPDLVDRLTARAREVPFWVRSGGENVASYFGFIAGSMPLLAVGGAAAMYWIIRRYGMLGLYLTLWFGVPFLVHCMLPWKAGRFIVLALPALLIAVAMASADLLAGSATLLSSRSRAARTANAERSPAVRLAVVVVALAAVTPVPVQRIAMWLNVQPEEGWRESLAIARALPGVPSIPIGHTLPLPALHYWGDLDFTINEGLREQWLTTERRRAVLGVEGPAGYAWLPMGSPDFYTGRPVLTDAQSIRNHFAAAGEVLIGLHTEGPILGIDEGLRAALASEAQELCRGRCGPMVLYHWQFGSNAGEQPAKEAM